MWTINSNDVMQAKGRIERRRTEIETRYAEEKEALAAECAAIETLERAASEFAVRHIREDNPGFVPTPPPSAEADPTGIGEPIEEPANLDAATASDAAASEAEADPPAGEEAGGAFTSSSPVRAGA